MEEVKIKIKKIHPYAVFPMYAHSGDAGMDVVAISKKEFINSKFVEYGTGLSLEIPEGYVCLIFPRSSISNKDLLLCNSVGVLDSGYRGELILRFKKLGKDIYEVGDRIGQIMIVSYPKIEIQEVGELNESVRGDGGWGSTGN